MSSGRVGLKGYKEQIFTARYTSEQLNDCLDDIAESTLIIEDVNEFGDFKGEIRVTVDYIPQDSCECQGLQHSKSCPHWEIGF